MILADIRTRILTRMEVDPTDANWKTAATSAINEGQRLFAFLTLCQETTREFLLTPGTAFYHMFAEGWADWLVPLRVRVSNDTGSGQSAQFDNPESDAAMFGQAAYSGLTTNPSPKLRPATLYQMAAENDAWLNATGTPTEYGCIGWDLLFLNNNPTQSGQTLLITYARSTVALVNDGDVPELHESDHEALINYGTWRLRCNEGGQELQSSNALFKSYLACAKQRADQVRARSLAQRYDRLPFEIEDWDYSRLLGTRQNLTPYRSQNRWTA